MYIFFRIKLLFVSSNIGEHDRIEIAQHARSEEKTEGKLLNIETNDFQICFQLGKSFYP